jgi:K+-sensing histidine kinase KdpD
MKAELEHDAAMQQITLETLIRENERLRGDLLTVARRICHDLRTPLGGILTTSEILKEVLVENGVASEVLMATIFDSAEDMTRLIDRVSFVLKASANPIANQHVKMSEVVFRVLQCWEGKILKTKVTISEPASWPEVNGVFSWLEVVWGNLLANALSYGKDRIELGWEKERGEFRLWISDNGNGVPTGKCDKLFQSFDSLHEPNAKHGLGLSITQRLVELQGGRCGYEPRVGGGACFYFTLRAENTTAPLGNLQRKVNISKLIDSSSEPAK